MDWERLAARLARLREQPPPDPPAAIEAQLRARFAARRSQLRRKRLAWLGAGLVTGAATITLVIWWRPSGPASPGARPVAGATAAVGERALAVSPRPGRFRALRLSPDPAAERPPGHVARVELGAATAAYLGLPVAADVPRGRIQAEVLYGEDGVAHGVRLLPASFRSLPLPSENEQAVQQGVEQ